MSGSTPLIDHIDFSSAQKEVIVNRVNDAEAPAAALGIKTLIGLSLTLYGGTIINGGTPAVIANQTVALTDNATNYVKTTAAGVVSVVTTPPTSWPAVLGTVTALYTIVTSGGVYTTITEWRTALTTAAPFLYPLKILTPAYASTVTLDATDYSAYAVIKARIGTLTGPITFNITGGTDGQTFHARFKQDGTGGRLLTPGANLRFSNDLPTFVLTVAANKIDRASWEWDGADSKADILATNKGY